MAPYVPARGDLIWLRFNPQARHEQAGNLEPRPFTTEVEIEQGVRRRMLGEKAQCNFLARAGPEHVGARRPQRRRRIGGHVVVVLDDKHRAAGKTWRAAHVERALEDGHRMRCIRFKDALGVLQRKLQVASGALRL